MIRAFTKYLCKPRFLFAVSKEGVKAEETEDITLAFFYRRLLRNTKVKPNGNSKFNPYDLHYMARLTQQPHEADLLLEAYYNFLGHNTRIAQKTTDLVVTRYIEINPNPEKILQLYQKHYLLRYFPHYDTTFKLLEQVCSQPQNLKRLLGIIHNCPFIKVDKRFIIKAMEALDQLGERKQLRKLYLYSAKRVPEAAESAEMVPYLGKITKLPESQYVTKAIDSLKSSKRDEDIHQLARIYLGVGKSVPEALKELSRLTSLEGEGISDTFAWIEFKSRSAFVKNPQAYSEIVNSYNSLLKGKPKSPQLQQIEARILNMTSEQAEPQEGGQGQQEAQPEPEPPKQKQKEGPKKRS